jgi:hypothetical protein
MAIFKDGAPAATWEFYDTNAGNILAAAAFDTNIGSHCASTGIFTVPAGHAGMYWMGMTAMAGAAGSSTTQVYVRKNGTLISTGMKTYTTGTLYDRLVIFGVIALSAGDTIDFYNQGPKQLHQSYGTCNVYMMY